MIMENAKCLEQDDRRTSLSEVCTLERKLWATINVNGLLDPEVRQLYRVAVGHYESIVLKDGEREELQEVEYSLWKLHYKHIEEFRKRIKKGPAAGCLNGADGHAEGIESFVLDATVFYKGLVAKLKEFLGKDGGNDYMETPIVRTRKFLCHRFLICIGDLARYKELYRVPENRDCDWSVPAAFYLEASRLWPEGGNPHNQLALLATYVGDDFHALYHCVRSLAVKEPFPDAWNNLVLLLDKVSQSRLSMPNSISGGASFDFSKPSERILYSSNCHSSEEQHPSSSGRIPWQHFVRTIGFFLIDFSLVDFEAAFASAIKELELLMKLDDVSLDNALESYRFMNPLRTGPFRAIQAVSVLIFVVESLINSPSQKASDNNVIIQQNLSLQHARAATFIFVGRLVDRCLESSEKALCPVLPAVLVFSEWLTSNLPGDEISRADERSRGAMSYFFRGFVELLNLLNSKSVEVNFEGCALWEDYELRGFSPAASTQAYLDFSYNSEHLNSFRSGYVCRVNRIIISGIKIAGRPLGSHMWFTYDESRKEFCYAVEGTDKSEDQEEVGENASEQSIHCRSVILEEEEVILFKPLTRHNSAPVSKLIMPQNHVNNGVGRDPTASPNEYLRRASTMLPAQVQGGNQSPTSSLHDVNEAASSFWEFPMSSGPPSLSAWVIDGESSVIKKEKADKISKVRLPPIEETLADLLVGQTTRAEDSITAFGQESVIDHYPTPYSAAVPSAPLLPEDTVFGVPENYYSTQPERIHSNWAAASGFPQASAPSLTGFIDMYPRSHPMTSSEWLRQFREINNIHQDYSNWPRWQSPNSFHGVSIPRYDPLNPWGNVLPTSNPLASDHLFFYSNNQLPQPSYLPFHGSDEHYKMDKVSYGYPRTSPYGFCGASTDDRVDQETRLRYLKQKEWTRFQKDPNLQGPTF